MSHDHNSDEEWKLLVDEIMAQIKAGLLAMERLNRIVAIHDDARARKDYALSDQIRKALDISLPTPGRRLAKDIAKDIRADYQARFDVSTESRRRGKSLVAFLATPPA